MLPVETLIMLNQAAIFFRFKRGIVSEKKDTKKISETHILERSTESLSAKHQVNPEMSRLD